MPLQIQVPATEIYDEAKGRFFFTPKTVLTLEHSLISVSHWEEKWHRPYLYQTVLTEEANQKTKEEELDYIRCMTIGNGVDPNVYRVLRASDIQKIKDYINNPMTATKIRQQQKKPNREIVTNELIYYWMVAAGIPFKPCETWHLNKLLTLIGVYAAKNQEQEKANPRQQAQQRHSINAARRAAHARRR